MAVLPEHICFYEDVFSASDVVRGNVITMGLQDLRFSGVRPPPSNFLDWLTHYYWRKRIRTQRYRWLLQLVDFAQMLQNFGACTVTSLDFFDDRADLVHDMNNPISAQWVEQYDLVIDIGSTEHIFDSRQCIENLLRLTKIGGHIMLHLPVSGYFAHGLHVFNPQCILDCLELNGFDICYLAFSSRRGRRLRKPHPTKDTILWALARKTKTQAAGFINPQQKVWEDYYGTTDLKTRFSIQRNYRNSVGSSRNGS